MSWQGCIIFLVDIHVLRSTASVDSQKILFGRLSAQHVAIRLFNVVFGATQQRAAVRAFPVGIEPIALLVLSAAFECRLNHSLCDCFANVLLSLTVVKPAV